MTKSDARELIERLNGLAELYDKKISPAVHQIWFNSLKDLELVPVLEAMNHLVCTSKYMPKPSEVRDLVCGDAASASETAWIAWREAAAKVGGYSSLLIEDPVLAETLTAMFGSWVKACAAEFSEEMWSAKRKEFERVYRVMALRNLDGYRYLQGSVEIANAGKFPERPHPMGAIFEGGKVHRQISQADIDALKLLAATAKPAVPNELSA